MTQRIGQAFRRANMMLAAISGILAATVNDMNKQRAELAALGQYVSRGKGEGGGVIGRGRHGQHRDIQRSAKKRRNSKARACIRGTLSQINRGVKNANNSKNR